MSHFSVLVIGKDFEKQLEPYQEFECTGKEGPYVKDVDRTEEARAEYAEHTTTMLRKIDDGTLHSYFDEKGEWRPEFSVKDKHGQRDRFEPVGYEQVEVPIGEVKPFADWASDYYGSPIVPFGTEPNLDDTHKYGYTLVDGKREVIKLIDRTNPDATWDWYSVGGRWTGFFKLKPGASGEIGRPGVMGNKAESGTADILRKKDVDFQAMRDELGEKAAKRYDDFMKILNGREIPIWSEIRGRHGEGNIDAARKEWRSHPVNVDLNADPYFKDYFGWSAEPEEFNVSREQYVQTERDTAGVPFAVVKDGQWFGRGKMGWWGVVHDEKDQNDWNRQFATLIDGLPEDTLFTVVDCHI